MAEAMARPPDNRSVLDAIDEPALLLSGSIIQLANGAAKRLFGRDIEGSDVRLAVRQPQVLEQVIAGVPADVEFSGIGRFDRPWTAVIRPLTDKCLLVRFVDRSAALSAEKMRVDFVANASHELRTPLSVILGYAETVREQGDELDRDSRRRFVGIIHEEAKRMQRLVEDLISLSKIEGQRFNPLDDPVDLAALAAEAVTHWSGLAEERKATVEVDSDPDLEPTMGDRNQLLQLLDNLLSNALRYGRIGGRVRIQLHREGRMLRITVSDEGEGIPPEHIPRLTERFYRVDKARSRDSGGTGLGLAIVKHIVERHRGQLDIRSTVGRGTDVHVLLPVAEDGAAGPPTSHSEQR